MKQGAVDEDQNVQANEWFLRYQHHHWNPLTNAKSKWPTSKTAYIYAGELWTKASNAFGSESRRHGGDEVDGTQGSFHAIGRVLHVLQDMASPPHVHAPDGHGWLAPGNTGPGGSSYGYYSDFEEKWSPSSSVYAGWGYPAVTGGVLTPSDAINASIPNSRLDNESLTEMRNRLSSIPSSERSKIEGYMKAQAWMSYFHTSFYGQINKDENNPAPSSSGSSRISILRRLFPNRISFTSGSLGNAWDDYWTIDGVGYYDKRLQYFPEDWWPCPGAYPIGNKQEGSGTSWRILGRFYIYLHYYEGSTSGYWNRATRPNYYPDGTSNSLDLAQYYGNVLLPLSARFGAGLLNGLFPAPSSLSYPSSSSTGQYTVSWGTVPSTDAGSPTGYILERSRNGGSWTEVYAGPNRSYSENVGDGSYQYRVRARWFSSNFLYGVTRTETSTCNVTIPTRIISLSGDLAFGNVIVGQGPQRTMTVSNTGNSTLSVSSISCPSGFSASPQSFTVGAGGSRDVTITFSPAAAQSYGGTITVNSDKTSGTNTRSCSGTGIAPTRVIRLTGDLSFGGVTLGQSVQRTMTVYNDGNSTLAVSSISCPSGFSASSQSFTVSAGGSRDVTITFNPTVAQSYSGTVTVNSDRTSGTNTRSCSGDVIKEILTNVNSVSVPEGGTNTFGVRLGVQPPGDVAVSVSRVSGDTDIAVSGGGTLTFTPTNWNTYQIVSLTAAEDADAIDGTATITCSASGWTSKSMTATESDNDREILTDRQTVSVPEGGTVTFQVRLKAQPGSNVVVSVSRVSGDSDISVSSGSSLTFTTSNWSTYQTVTLAAAEDADAKDDVATIRCSATGWTGKDVTATENDNDREFITNTNAMTVPEKGTASFQIKLKGQPSGSVVVTVARVSGDPDITVQSGAQLTFDSGNWNTYQTVTLAAAEDADAVNGTATIRCSATGWANKDITATEDDAQGSLTVTSPNGGEKWEQGTSHNIVWTSSGNPGPNVKIEYSPTNGGTWFQITASTDNDGSHPWTVPDVASAQFLVRVTSTTKPEISGTSGAVFTVIGSPHHLAFGTQPTNTIATEGPTPAISPSPTVKICDAANNTVTSSSANVSLALVGGGGSGAELRGTATKAAVSGVVTFNDLRITRAGTGFQLQATCGGVTAASSSTFNVTAQPALTIAMQDNADPVNANDQVTYTITYGNTGLAPATGVVVTETLPSSLTFVSATGGGTYSAATGTVTWNVGTLGVQTTGQTVTFIAKVKAEMADGGPITHNQLTIRCDQTGTVTALAETTTVRDTKPPQVLGCTPGANAEMVPCGGIIRLHVTDGGSGVRYDGETVTIRIEGDLIYDGAHETASGVYNTKSRDQAVRGICRRSGTAADYEFAFTPSTRFDHEQSVDVVVTVADVAGNTDTISYSFTTETRFFGKNAKVNSDSGKLIQDHPATAVDSAGNIWVVWDQQVTGTDTDIYIGKLAAGGSAFGASAAVYTGANVQSHPVIAVDRNNGLYVAWQSLGTNGKWDVYVSRSSNGSTWTEPLAVNVGDPNNTSSQRFPSIAADNRAPGTVYVVYEDDRAGNKDIWIATSTNGTAWTETRITTHSSDQTLPRVFIDPNDSTAYALWTDARNAATQGTNIYAASSANSWNNIAVVTGTSNEASGVGAAYGTIYLAWVSQQSTPASVYYGSDAGGLPIAGTRIADEAGVSQASPSLALRRDTRGTKLFAVWQDGRDAKNGDATDIYFAESGSPFGTNILVNDDTGRNAQSAPVVGVDHKGNPYVVWVDERNGNKDIYYAGAVSINDPLPTTVVTTGGKTTVRATGQANLEVEIPQMPSGVQANEITIAEVSNPPQMPSGTNAVGLKYEFGPTGLQFAEPVTIRIPLTEDGGYSTYRVYRYDPNDLTSPSFPWTEDGIHNPATNQGTYLEVQVDHFSIYGAAGITVPPPGGGGGGGGGGCAISPYDGCDPVEFMLPFVAYVLILLSMGLVRERVHCK